MLGLLRNARKNLAVIVGESFADGMNIHLELLAAPHLLSE
jgi:hypothetical protein